MKPIITVALCILVALLLAAGGAQAAKAAKAPPRSVLDRGTGATIQYSAKPWVLALEQPQLASHSRDYIALYAVDINISGKHRQQLAVFFWSTVPSRQRFAGTAPILRLRVEDRDLELSSQGQSPRDLGISRWPLEAPGRGALLVVYEVDQALLRQLGRVEQFRLRPETDPTLPEDVWFTPWRSAQREFQAFADLVLEP